MRVEGSGLRVQASKIKVQGGGKCLVAVADVEGGPAPDLKLSSWLWGMR